jgi:hypothetical protein
MTDLELSPAPQAVDAPPAAIRTFADLVNEAEMTVEGDGTDAAKAPDKVEAGAKAAGASAADDGDGEGDKAAADPASDPQKAEAGEGDKAAADPAKTDPEPAKEPTRKEIRLKEALAEKAAAVRYAQRAVAQRDAAITRLNELNAQAADPSDHLGAFRLEAQRVNAEEFARAAHDQAAQAQQAAFDASKVAWGELVAEGSTAYADFVEKVHAPGLQVTPVMAEALLELATESGTKFSSEVAYHLAQNPQEASRIAALDPLKQALAISRLGARIEAKQPAKPAAQPTAKAPAAAAPAKAADAPKPAPRVTQAPPPPGTVRGSSASNGFDWEGSDMDNFAAELNRKMARKRH